MRAFAHGILAAHDALHGLVNDAGVMNTKADRTVDGFETQFGTNPLGHVLLPDLPEPALLAGAPSRVVAVSRAYHDVAVGRQGAIDLEDPTFLPIEIESTTRPRLDARGLRAFRAEYGTSARAGVLLHDGELTEWYSPTWSRCRGGR